MLPSSGERRTSDMVVDGEGRGQYASSMGTTLAVSTPPGSLYALRRSECSGTGADQERQVGIESYLIAYLSMGAGEEVMGGIYLADWRWRQASSPCQSSSSD